MASGLDFADQHDHAAPLASDDLHGLVHQRLAVGPGRDHVVDGVESVHAHEHRAA